MHTAHLIVIRGTIPVNNLLTGHPLSDSVNPGFVINKLGQNEVTQGINPEYTARENNPGYEPREIIQEYNSQVGI